MSRYPEWPEYYARTGMLLPRLRRRAAAATPAAAPRAPPKLKRDTAPHAAPAGGTVADLDR